jgi:RNA recognition motif-containing protein
MKSANALKKLSEQELKSGIAGSGASWHDEFKDSSCVFVGGLARELNEGDIVAVFSQYGEVVEVNLARDTATGQSRGFAWVCYADQRSAVLAVDNFNGIQLLGRTIKVDHTRYRRKRPKPDEEPLEPEGATLVPPPPPSLPPPPPLLSHEEEEEDVVIDKELEEIEEKLIKAETRLAKWRRRLRAAKEAADAKAETEAEREVGHLERVMRRLTRKQEKRWHAKK